MGQNASSLRMSNDLVANDTGSYPAVEIKLAVPADVPFLDRLRRRDSTALGFLSSTALAQKVRLGVVSVATVDGRPAGFLLHGSMRGPEVRVFQLAVDPAFRGGGVGRRLVADLIRRCVASGKAGLSLRCRDRLTANRFWHKAGFALHDLEPARRGALFVWVRELTPGRKGDGVAHEVTMFRFHSRWHACPRCDRPTCDTWGAGGIRRATCDRCSCAGREKSANPPPAVGT